VFLVRYELSFYISDDDILYPESNFPLNVRDLYRTTVKITVLYIVIFKK
jgi:hypothetical protein